MFETSSFRGYPFQYNCFDHLWLLLTNRRMGVEEHVTTGQQASSPYYWANNTHLSQTKFFTKWGLVRSPLMKLDSLLHSLNAFCACRKCPYIVLCIKSISSLCAFYVISCVYYLDFIISWNQLGILRWKIYSIFVTVYGYQLIANVKILLYVQSLATVDKPNV